MGRGSLDTAKRHGGGTLSIRSLLPNAVTLLRLSLAPAAVWFILYDHLGAAFWIFTAAGLSDALDGALARLMQAQSALGSYLDALADKVLLVGVYVALGWSGLVWGWLVGLVVCRDLLLVGVAAGRYFWGAERQVTPLLVSKVNTLAQILLAGVVLGTRGQGLFPGWLTAPLSGVVAATTAASGAAYLMGWSAQRRRSD